MRSGYTRNSTVESPNLHIADLIFSRLNDRRRCSRRLVGNGFVGVAVRGYTHDYFVANLVVPRLIRCGSEILAIGDDLVARVAWTGLLGLVVRIIAFHIYMRHLA